MLHRFRIVALGGLLSLVLAACGTSIPPGAQRVHVAGTGTEVRLDPSTVHAGDAYFVLDGSALFFASAETPDGEIGPLSEDGLTRLAQAGDTFHTWSTVLSPGYAGNAYKFNLHPGKYAFVPVPDKGEPSAALMTPPVKVAVLEVVP